MCVLKECFSLSWFQGKRDNMVPVRVPHKLKIQKFEDPDF